jgi:hypothetical protein
MAAADWITIAIAVALLILLGWLYWMMVSGILAPR